MRKEVYLHYDDSYQFVLTSKSDSINVDDLFYHIISNSICTCVHTLGLEITDEYGLKYNTPSHLIEKVVANNESVLNAYKEITNPNEEAIDGKAIFGKVYGKVRNIDLQFALGRKCYIRVDGNGNPTTVLKDIILDFITDQDENKINFNKQHREYIMDNYLRKKKTQ